MRGAEGVRWMCLAAGMMAATLMARGQAVPGAKTGEPMLLWPNGAPGALGNEEGDRPTLQAFLPAENPTGTAVVILPGGGYQHLAVPKEGADMAQWLNAQGVAAFVLMYRLGPKYHFPVEWWDAQRALRTVRADAEKYGVKPDHIGILGFSAGGHLAATAATRYDDGKPQDKDPIERQGSRPDFAILAYPVITLEAPVAHAGSRVNLLGEHPDPAQVRELSAQTQVTSKTPPTFLFATSDDAVVPVANSVMFYTALVAAGVPVEMHLFQHGAHGAGLAKSNPQLSVWPDLLGKWMRERGLAQ